MTLTVNTNQIINSNIAKSNVTSSTLKNDRIANSPVFCGALMEIKGKKAINRINWLGDDFDSAMQRFVSGITAILTQPFFDLHNKNTDEKTRKTSCARTIGKIIAGTLTGVLIREACIQATKKFTQHENVETALAEKAEKNGKVYTKKTNFKAWEQCLLPNLKKDMTYRQIKKYRGAIGTFTAVGIMIATNFLIDAPLTTYFTNVFVKKMNKGSEVPEQKPVKGGKQ